jgi:hypothetical protein
MYYILYKTIGYQYIIVLPRLQLIRIKQTDINIRISSFPQATANIELIYLKSINETY